MNERINKKDIAYATKKGLIASIPTIGGVASELFSLAISSPMEKRRDEWINVIAQQVEEISKQINGISLESISSNDEFISLVLSTTQIALRNHKEEKLIALRNIVKNTLLDIEPNEEYRAVFLSMIDTLTVTHIKLLILFNNPQQYIENNSIPFRTENIMMGNLGQVINACFPELREHKELYTKAFKDLYMNGLLNTESINGTMTGNGLLQQRTTSFGNKFVDFIS